jgi:hypothetical protein
VRVWIILLLRRSQVTKPCLAQRRRWFRYRYRQMTFENTSLALRIGGAGCAHGGYHLVTGWPGLSRRAMPENARFCPVFGYIFRAGCEGRNISGDFGAKEKSLSLYK